VKCIFGLDIGGANLKAATNTGRAITTPFELWRHPADLPAALTRLTEAMPAFDAVAVTMTGELCDCFANKSDGVHSILDAVRKAFGKIPQLIWTTGGAFVHEDQARAAPLNAASANWLALAAFAGRYAQRGSAMLLDIGSTTTDLIPLFDGTPVPRGRTDPERFRSGELLYRGVDRTPVCALMGTAVAAEWFATMLDVHVVLGHIPEDPNCRRTADGRPATSDNSRARLARMLCEDPAEFALEAARDFAQRVHAVEFRDLVHAIAVAMGSTPPATVVLTGAGEFLGRNAVAIWLEGIGASAELVSLGTVLGPHVSQAACAFAVAVLAGEKGDVG
jgi:probable H4MPT-linked C1 transfer pathway protein